jgi:hypothetical protein
MKSNVAHASDLKHLASQLAQQLAQQDSQWAQDNQRTELLILQRPLVTVRGRDPDKGVPTSWEVHLKTSVEIPKGATLLSTSIAETYSGWAVVLILQVLKEETP